MIRQYWYPSFIFVAKFRKGILAVFLDCENDFVCRINTLAIDARAKFPDNMINFFVDFDEAKVVAESNEELRRYLGE